MNKDKFHTSKDYSYGRTALGIYSLIQHTELKRYNSLKKLNQPYNYEVLNNLCRNAKSWNVVQIAKPNGIS